MAGNLVWELQFGPSRRKYSRRRAAARLFQGYYKRIDMGVKVQAESWQGLNKTGVEAAQTDVPLTIDLV